MSESEPSSAPQPEKTLNLLGQININTDPEKNKIYWSFEELINSETRANLKASQENLKDMEGYNRIVRGNTPLSE